MFGERKTIIESFFGGGFLFVLAIFGSIIVMAATRTGLSTLIFLFSCVGAGLVIRAKWPALKEKKWMSFGPKEMDSKSRKYYFVGYAILIIGFILGLLLRSIPPIR